MIPISRRTIPSMTTFLLMAFSLSHLRGDLVEYRNLPKFLLTKIECPPLGSSDIGGAAARAFDLYCE
jgi:hypothetical protein